MLGKLATQVGLGWLGRRIPDWGGWIMGIGGFLIYIFGQLDPATQKDVMDAVGLFFTNWREVSLGQVATVLGAIALAWSQRRSYKATVEPQIVTPQGNKVAKEVAADQNPAAVNSAIRAADNAAAEQKIAPREGRLRAILKALVGK